MSCPVITWHKTCLDFRYKWRQRFSEHRINGLHDEARPGKPRPGKPRTIDDERVAELIDKTLHTKPADGATHWRVRAIATADSILAKLQRLCTRISGTGH